MGWTGLHREPGMTDREFFEREFPVGLTEKGEIIACGSVNFTFYAAVQQKDTGEVWALVVLMRRNRGHYNFAYKDMSETMGPGYHDCPKNVLDALTPTDSEWALEWREACRKHHERRDAARGLKPGAVIEFERPVPFANGREYTRFRLIKGNTLVAVEDGIRVRFNGWRDRAWTLTEEAA